MLRWHNTTSKAATVARASHHTAVGALVKDLGARVAVDNFDDKWKFAILPLRKYKISDGFDKASHRALSRIMMMLRSTKKPCRPRKQ